MKTISGDGMFFSMRTFSEMAKVFDPNASAQSIVHDDSSKQIAALLSSFGNWLFTHGFVVTNSLTIKLSSEMAVGMAMTVGDVLNKLDQLDSTFKAELTSFTFLLLEAENTQYYQATDLFGPLVSLKFPKANYDIAEAGNCYGLGRSTACVLHLMRVLDIGLTALGKKLGIKLDEPKWADILNKIHAELKRRENAPNRPANWKKSRQFYSEAAVQLWFFKDAWRNYAMHSKEKYTEQEAKNIYDHVNSFMNHLAKKIKG